MKRLIDALFGTGKLPAPPETALADERAGWGLKRLSSLAVAR